MVARVMKPGKNNMKLLCSNTHICTWADFHPVDSPDLFRNCRVNQEISSKYYMLLLCFRGPNSHHNGSEKFSWPNPRTRRQKTWRFAKWLIHPLLWRQNSFYPTPSEECKWSVQDWTALPSLYVNYSLPSPFAHFALHFPCLLHHFFSELPQLPCALLSSET